MELPPELESLLLLLTDMLRDLFPHVPHERFYNIVADEMSAAMVDVFNPDTTPEQMMELAEKCTDNLIERLRRELS